MLSIAVMATAGEYSDIMEDSLPPDDEDGCDVSTCHSGCWLAWAGALAGLATGAWMLLAALRVDFVKSSF